MIIGDRAEIAGCHTSFLYCQLNRNNICFCFYKCIQLPPPISQTMKDVKLRAQIWKYMPLTVINFIIFGNGALMNKTKLASFTVNAVKCFFSVGAAQ